MRSFRTSSPLITIKGLASPTRVFAPLTIGTLGPAHSTSTSTSTNTAFHSPKPHPQESTHAHALESALQSLPLLSDHRARPDAHEWYETRPYASLPPAIRAHTFTAGTLRGPGKLALPALVRVRRDESESLVLVHLGRDLCGHDGIVHGGMLAALLDEALGRTGVLSLPGGVGFTASMTVEYRSQTRADQFVAIRTTVARKEGRKAWVEGVLEDLSGKALVEAKALYIQPSKIDLPDKAKLRLRQILGEPEPLI
ncbi:hypothetical protein HWV62_45182 [Athelia sp. TMB]|nr:hypothetical protein HWV62_45182 [Athelia sp. TMB]